MAGTRSHYQTLGVAPDASQAAIRDAYRQLARRYHPDQNAASAAGADRMPQVNEAYRVLSDPARRAVYDASRRDSIARVVSDADLGRRFDGVDVGDHDEDYAWRLRESQRPVRLPWRTILVFTVIAVAAVLVLAQFGDSDGQPPIDGIMRIGDCAEVLPDGRAAEVPCSADGVDDLVVSALIPFEQRCISGSLHQDRQGMGNVCLEPRP